MAILQMAVRLSDGAYTPSRPADSDEEDRLSRSETRSLASSVGEAVDVRKLHRELTERVRDVRAAVDEMSVAGGGEEGESEVRAIWAMLSFTLDDWK